MQRIVTPLTGVWRRMLRPQIDVTKTKDINLRVKNKKTKAMKPTAN